MANFSPTQVNDVVEAVKKLSETLARQTTLTSEQQVALDTFLQLGWATGRRDLHSYRPTITLTRKSDTVVGATGVDLRTAGVAVVWYADDSVEESDTLPSGGADVTFPARNDDIKEVHIYSTDRRLLGVSTHTLSHI